MIFMKSLNAKLNFFIDTIDSDILKIFTIGFYQLLNKEVSSSYNSNVDVIDKKELMYFLENIISLEEEVAKSSPSEEIAFFLTHIAHMYASLMMIENSLLFYKESIKIRENYLELKSLATAENYQSIGAVYEQIGSFDKALGYYKKSLSIRKELSYVENNLLIAESYNRLALVYYYLEYYDLALDYIEQTVRIREKLLAPEHLLLENSYYNYRLIEKASQPRKDYLSMLLDPIRQITGAIINRLVG